MNKEIYDKYLSIDEHPSEIRKKVILFVLIFTDLFGLYCLLIPSQLTFALPFGLVLGVIINVWALLYIIAPYRFEMSFYLFFGTWGLFTSFIMFLVIQEVLYYIMGLRTFTFFYSAFFLFVLSIIYIQSFHLLYVNGKVKLPNDGSRKNWTILFAISPVLLFYSVQFVLPVIYGNYTGALILLGGECFLILYPIFCIKYIHQYYFLVKNKQALKDKYPELDLPKKERKSISPEQLNEDDNPIIINPKFRYEVIILDLNDELSDDEIEVMINKIGYYTEASDLGISILKQEHLTDEQKIVIKEKIKPKQYPYFLITSATYKELYRKMTEYKKKHWIKNMFNMIHTLDLHFSTEDYRLGPESHRVSC
ncbi:hypothetical protein [Pseudalkalibacillus decolorationis]|uniref:hypothetical protein n=1 Tax=Pseudalkalibacillus decolorationis TaxID=163879 RepID=UPI002148057E|nr:hypothetical protein [Pseudalkalibacillus decolorationis]